MWVHPFRPPSAGSVGPSVPLPFCPLPFIRSFSFPFFALWHRRDKVSSSSPFASSAWVFNSQHCRNAALSTMHICLLVSHPIVLSGPFFAFFCLGSFALFPSLLPYPLFVTHSRFREFQLLFVSQNLDFFSFCHHSIFTHLVSRVFFELSDLTLIMI